MHRIFICTCYCIGVSWVKGHDRELKVLSANAIRNRAKFDHFSIGISIGDIRIEI